MIKNFETVLLFFLVILVSGALFFGVVKAIKKFYKPSPKTETIDSFHMQSEQRRRMQKIKEQQKRLMQDQQQRLRDFRR